jgi:hypothetical protein
MAYLARVDFRAEYQDVGPGRRIGLWVNNAHLQRLWTKHPGSVSYLPVPEEHITVPAEAETAVQFLNTPNFEHEARRKRLVPGEVVH